MLIIIFYIQFMHFMVLLIIQLIITNNNILKLHNQMTKFIFIISRHEIYNEEI
jgi:hypothetical protein